MQFDPAFWQSWIPDQSKIFNVYAELALASVLLAMICMCLFKRASDGFKAVTFLGLTISAISFGTLAKKTWDESNSPPRRSVRLRCRPRSGRGLDAGTRWSPLGHRPSGRGQDQR